MTILVMQSSLTTLVLCLAAGLGRPLTPLGQPPRRAPRLSLCVAACLPWAQPRVYSGEVKMSKTKSLCPHEACILTGEIGISQNPTRQTAKSVLW